jgi:hypothetical protein
MQNVIDLTAYRAERHARDLADKQVKTCLALLSGYRPAVRPKVARFLLESVPETERERERVKRALRELGEDV